MANSLGDAYHRPAPKRIREQVDPIEQSAVVPIPRNPLPARILLAEDDQEFRSLLAMRLHEAGFDVVEATDGLELFDWVTRPNAPGDKFDLILSDINLPRVTALAVMAGTGRAIAETPVILMTAFGSTATHERARQLGAAAFIDKPFRLDDLCALMCRVLSTKPNGAA